MRVKGVSVLVVFTLCVSFLAAIVPPLARQAQANPMETLNVVFGEANFIQNGNWRPFTLAVSEKVSQFTRPDLIVGNNATGSLYTVSKMSWPVTGDLTGTVFSDFNSVVVTWDGLPFPKGYAINTITFDDGYSNTFSGIMVMDVDFTASPTGTGRIVSTAGTGTFSGKRLIGTCSTSGTATMLVTLRCYSGSEISSPQAFSGTGTLSGTGGGLLGTSTGPLSYDEFLRFSGPNGIFSKDCLASYQSSTSTNGPVSGALTGTLSQSMNGCAVFSGYPLGPSTVVGGWNVGKFSFSTGNGTITGVLAGDSSGDVYMFALREAATGLYADRDYYATATGGTTGDPNNPTGVSYSGSLYTLTAPGYQPPPPTPANPMETMNVVFGEANFIQNGNWRPFTLAVSEKVSQFTRPDLIVGNNATGSLYTVSKMSWPVTGDLTGTVFSDFNSVVVTWDGLPFPKGYAINTITFDDGYSNTFSGIMVMDVDFTASPTGTGRIVSTAGTGTFSGKRLIGTCSTSGTATMLVTLRCYSGSEISSPQAFSGTGTLSGTGGGLLGTSTGPLSYDEFLRFSGPNGIFSKDCLASYQSSTSTNGPVSGALTGTLSQSMNGCAVFSGYPLGPSTVVGGWNVGTFSFSAGNGTVTGVLVGDSSGDVYMFALREAATGLYANRDYYATATGGTTGDPNNPSGVSYSGSLYTLTPPGVALATATGTGTAVLGSTSGAIENLTAVSATSPSTSLPQEAIDAAEQAGLNFPHGLFEFRITGLADGDSVALTISLPSAIPDNAQYWKYGPTPGDPTYHWYQIPWTRISSNVIAISLTDGGWGDDDLTADGTIIDQGGPGWPWPTGGGGGSVPVFPSIYIGIGAALGAGILAYFARRRLGHS